MLEKTKSPLPRFVAEGWIIPDEQGCWGNSKAKLKINAPQWAKDEYKKWIAEIKKDEEAMKRGEIIAKY
ncbi:MAG: hypothetical protein RR436_03555 [Clostridia bacterium]